MPAMPSRANAFTPPPESGDTGIMPDLYRLHVGPVNAAYYQQHFQRFESMGKATPTWNHGAAFFTLSWLLLRKLWRPAGIYAALLTALLALWWWGIHGRVAMPFEVALGLLTALVLCAGPGFLGNALYFHHVRQHTVETLTRATSLSQARVQLAEHATTKNRLHAVAGTQALVSAAIAVAVFSHMVALKGNLAKEPPTPLPNVGPPALVIPSISSVPPLELEPFTPAIALPAPEASPASAPHTDIATTSMAAIALDASTPEVDAPSKTHATTPAAPPSAAPLNASELSIVALAQSVPTPSNGSTKTGAAPSVAPTAPLAPRQTVPPSKAKPISPAEKVAAKTSVAAATPAAHRLQPGKFYLNAGVYAQASNVETAVQKLNAAKLATLRQTLSSKNGDMTRLRIGPFDSRQQAEQAAAKVQKMHIPASIFQHPR